jgi:tripartite-type tricarboxylate transporter receptor subunit TctC
MGSRRAVGGFSSLCIQALRALIQEGTHMTSLKFPRRQFLHLAAGAAALPVVSRNASAQAYPVRQVRVIVGFPPGGAVDVVARLIGQALAERLGQPFVIENRPGAGGNIGTEAVIRAPADGYTLLLVGASNAINATLYDKLNFVFLRDITPIASIERQHLVMLVNPSEPSKTIPAFIAYAEANAGRINMASAGNGSPSHLAGELFKVMTSVKMIHVPYRGDSLAITDLLGGQVQLYFGSLPGSIGHIRADRLRGLAVTSATRSELLPDIPTVAEFVAGYEVSSWYGIGAPKNTPTEIVSKLNNEINAALASPVMKARIADHGGTVLGGSPTEFGKLIAEETEKWGKVIRAANIKAE